MADAAQHLGRSDHLRDRLRRHEGADLDGVEPGADQRLDEGDPVGDADRGLLILQAVARADFDDADASLIGLLCRFDFGEFDALADDIADLAFDLLQHARKGRAQGLLHLHDFQRQDRGALFQRRALLGQQRHHGARQAAPRSCPRRPAPRSRRRTDRPNAGRSGRCGCANRARGPRSRRRRGISCRRASDRNRRHRQATS